jgi:hypothetical protein
MDRIRVRIKLLDGSEIVREALEITTQGQSLLLFDLEKKKSELDPIDRKKLVAGYWNIVGFEVEDASSD